MVNTLVSTHILRMDNTMTVTNTTTLVNMKITVADIVTEIIRCFERRSDSCCLSAWRTLPKWIKYKVAKKLSWFCKVRRRTVVHMDRNTISSSGSKSKAARPLKVPFQNVTNLRTRRSDATSSETSKQVPTIYVEGTKAKDPSPETSSPFRGCFRVPDSVTPRSLILLRQGTQGTTSLSRRRRSSFSSPGFVDARRYEIIALLGAGGFGRVYKATYKGKLYAVKKIHSCTKNQKATFESHQAERLAMKLRHPNVVRILATSDFDHPGGALIVMEYVGDRNLQQVIFDQSYDFHLERCIKFAMNVSDALDYVHRKNIIHLDVKPANIIVSTEDVCKLGDFGCCRVVDSSALSDSPSQRSHLTGTFAYRAPELLRGETPNRRADVYSLGITMWQMLSRELPYSGDPHAIIFAVVAYNLRPTIPSSGGDIQTSYNQLYKSCWASKHVNRPAAFEVSGTLKKLRAQLFESH